MAMCERCAAELDHGVTLPEWARGPIWSIAGEQRRSPPMLRRLFKILWSRRDVVVSRDSIMMLLYGLRADPPEDGTVRVLICKLRRLLDGGEWDIANFYGDGWQLVPRNAELDRRKAAAAQRVAVSRLRARGLAMLAARSNILDLDQLSWLLMSEGRQLNAAAPMLPAVISRALFPPDPRSDRAATDWRARYAAPREGPGEPRLCRSRRPLLSWEALANGGRYVEADIGHTAAAVRRRQLGPAALPGQQRGPQTGGRVASTGPPPSPAVCEYHRPRVVPRLTSSNSPP
jgi:DNA-binding winged helix-turn-helix (wHTH) protein